MSEGVHANVKKSAKNYHSKPCVSNLMVHHIIIMVEHGKTCCSFLSNKLKIKNVIS